ncbi:MAG: hypothetical protein GEV09_16260 [Pseudonocardiaceae bacterium]|nr:hypothetical protein [Pseudonocardiaceae bacterium]
MSSLMIRPDDVSSDPKPLGDIVTGQLPSATRLVSFGGEVVVATATAVGTSLAIQLLVGVVTVPVSSLVPVALGALGAAALVGVLLTLSVLDLRGRRLRGTTR